MLISHSNWIKVYPSWLLKPICGTIDGGSVVKIEMALLIGYLYGWNVVKIMNGHHCEQVKSQLSQISFFGDIDSVMMFDGWY